MPELILAIREYAGWLYALLALLAVREVLGLLRTGRDHDLALFGLEREAATGRAVRALLTLFLLVSIGVGVALVAEVLAPALPEQAARRSREDAPLIETPPTVVLPTDTPTPRPPTPTRRLPRIVTAAPEEPWPTSAPVAASLCRNPDVEIAAPAAGALSADGATVVVTVRFAPEAGRRFWLELGAGSPPTAWQLVGAPRTEPVEAAPLERLPAGLPPGPYVLRLLLSEPDGRVLPENVCEVPVRVP